MANVRLQDRREIAKIFREKTGINFDHIADEHIWPRIEWIYSLPFCDALTEAVKRAFISTLSSGNLNETS